VKNKLQKILLLVVLLSGLQVNAQVESCMKYDPNRTLDGFKLLVMTSKDPFMRNVLWPEYARLANNILKTSKDPAVWSFVVTADAIGMQWLMNHTVEYEWSYFKQSDYYNGTKVNNRLVYKEIMGHESGWAALEVGDITGGMYAKIQCANSEDPKIPLVRFEPGKQKPVKSDYGSDVRGVEEALGDGETQNYKQSVLFTQQPSVATVYLPNTTTTTKKVLDGVKVAKIGGVVIVVGALTTGVVYLLKKGVDKGSGTTTGGSRKTPGSHESGG
jgi:hypothetical protein